MCCVGCNGGVGVVVLVEVESKKVRKEDDLSG